MLTAATEMMIKLKIGEIKKKMLRGKLTLIASVWNFLHRTAQKHSLS